MLVLTRKPGEQIHIGPNITITVVSAKGSKIRIGIDAPDSIPIIRAELNDFADLPLTEATEPLLPLANQP